MAERVQVRDLEGPQIIRPVARPVDTYYRPAQQMVEGPDMDAANALKGLAGALSDIEPKLAAYAGAKQKEYSEEEIAKGRAAREANKMKFKEAADAGLIDRAANPWFIKGYMQAEGRLDGIDYEANLRQAYGASEVRNSDDPDAISKFMAEYRVNFLKENGKGKNRDWSDGFEPYLTRAESSLSSHHVSERLKARTQGFIDNTGLEVSKIAEGAYWADLQLAGAGDEAAREANRVNARTAITNLLREGVKSGADGKLLNKAAIDALVAQGVEAKDVAFLDLADEIETAPGAKLSGGKEAKIALLSARNQIQRDLEHDEVLAHNRFMRPYIEEGARYQSEERNRRKGEHEIKDRTDPIVRKIQTDIMAGRRPKDTDMADLRALNPDLERTMYSFYNQFTTQNDKIDEDGAVVNTLVGDIARNPNDPSLLARINKLYPDKHADIPRIIQLTQMVTSHRNEGAAALKNPIFKNYADSLARVVYSLGPEAAAVGGPIQNQLLLEGIAIQNDAKLNDAQKAKAFDESYNRAVERVSKEAADEAKRLLNPEKVEKAAPPTKEAQKATAEWADLRDKRTAIEKDGADPMRTLPFIKDRMAQLEKLMAEEDAKPKAITPGPRDIEALRKNPKLADEFDAKFGAGAAAKAMRGK